jgi:hypothetical protein
MPSKSAKQHNLMEAVAHSPAFAKKVGIKQSVGKEFAAADKGKKFGDGGGVLKQGVNKPKTDHGAQAMFKKGGSVKHDDLAEDKKLIKKAFGMHDKQLHENKKTNLSKLKGGGMATDPTIEAGEKHLKFGEHATQKRGHTKGKNLGDSGPSKPSKEMCGGGKAKAYAKGGVTRADGIAQRGKTRGKMC